MNPLAVTKYLPLVPLAILVAIGVLSFASMVLNTALDMVPKPWRAAVVKRYPWTGNAAIVLRTGGNHIAAALAAAYRLITSQPVPPDANQQAAAFIRNTALKFSEVDPRRMALEYTAAQIARGDHTQPAPAIPPQSNGGFARRRPMVIAALLAIASLGAFSLHACSASQVHTQAVIATGAADGFNRAQGIVLAAYEQQSEAAARAVCCDRTQMLAAADAVDHRWTPVLASWELTLAAHDRWRVDLMACQQTIADGGTCTVDLAAEERAFLGAALDARCSVIALGVPDPLATLGPPACSSSSQSTAPSGAPVPSVPVSVPSPRVPSLSGGAS